MSKKNPNGLNKITEITFPFLKSINAGHNINYCYVVKDAPLDIMASSTCKLTVKGGGEIEVVTFLVDTENNVSRLPLNRGRTAKRTPVGYEGYFLTSSTAAVEILEHPKRKIQYVGRRVICQNHVARPTSSMRFIEIYKICPDTLEEICKTAIQLNGCAQFNLNRTN